MNEAKSNDEGECLSVIQLGEPRSNYMNLVMCNSTIEMAFESENQLILDTLGMSKSIKSLLLDRVPGSKSMKRPNHPPPSPL